MKLLKIVLPVLVTAFFFNACQKEYSVENGGLKLPVGNWEFVKDSAQYTGNMDTAYIISAGAAKELHLNGTSSDGSQNFQMVLYADSFKVGTYKASLFQSTFDYTTTAKTIYEAGQLVGEFVVNITSINTSLIVGTFSGSAKDSTGKLANLTLGKFKATFASSVNIPSSTGVLGDSSGTCKPVILNGTYTQGITATAANTAQVQVVVAVAGPYSISTNTVNGISFSALGTFTNTGAQNVILNASGTPELSGDQVFILQYGNSQCAFTVNFLPGVAPSGDYFPLTLNTNWTYGLEGTPGDSIFTKVVSYSPSIAGNTYQTLTQAVDATSTPDDSTYFRKPGGDYYQYLDFSKLFQFDQPVTGEFIFLKDNVALNTTWQTPNITGTVGGVAFSGYIKMTLIAKAVPVTLGNFNFPDVIKMKYELFMTGAPIVLQTQERWFAKNVGEIYTSVSDGTNTNTTNFIVGSYKIF